MSTRRTQSAKAAYHHGNLREALVSQGLSIVESEGLPALTMREIARRTGVTQTAPLHHFEGKEGLLAAIAALGWSPGHLEQARGAHAAAHAHRHHDPAHTAPPAGDERMPGHARAAHAEGMADGDSAAIDVQPAGIDAQPLLAIQHLHGERFV